MKKIIGLVLCLFIALQILPERAFSAALNAPKKFQANQESVNNPTKINFKWNSVSGAAGYIVYDSTHKVLTTKSTSGSIKNVAPGIHNYYVKAYDKKNVQSSASNTVTVKVLAAATITKCIDNGKGSIYLQWKLPNQLKVKNVYIFKNGKLYIKDKANTSYTDSSVKKGEKYTYYIVVQSQDGFYTVPSKSASVTLYSNKKK